MIANLQAHYGFTRMPFGTAIPAEALYASAAHKEAVARLRWLISARGLGVITGEVGAGETVAVRAATASLDASRHTLIYLPTPRIGIRGIHGVTLMLKDAGPTGAILRDVFGYAESGRDTLQEMGEVGLGKPRSLRQLGVDKDVGAIEAIGHDVFAAHRAPAL